MKKHAESTNPRIKIKNRIKIYLAKSDKIWSRNLRQLWILRPGVLWRYIWIKLREKNYINKNAVALGHSGYMHTCILFFS